MSDKKGGEPNACIRLDDYDEKLNIDIRGSEEQLAVILFRLFEESPELLHVFTIAVFSYITVKEKSEEREHQKQQEKNGKPTIDRSEVN